MTMDGVRLRDVVQVELEQLEQYGDAAAEFFHELSGEIRREFTGALEELLTNDLTAFQSQVNRSLAQSSLGRSGMGDMGGALGNLMGDAVGAFMPDNLFGDVFGAAISGALRTAARDLMRNGAVDIGRAVTAGNRSGGNRLDTVIRRGDLQMSGGQRNAEAWAELGRGRRNL